MGWQSYVYEDTAYNASLVLFWMNLLLPSLSFLLGKAQSLKRSAAQIALALAAVGWYFLLMLLCHLSRRSETSAVLEKSLAIIGTALALTALCWIARNRSYVLVVPLAVAIVCGTVWMMVSLPLSPLGPYR